ncbi:hypothetical protein MTO96_031503 [Rhipicephalus appendiculatus]
MPVQKFRGNYAPRYGKSCEKETAEAYTKMTGDALTNVGLIVHPSSPWLGYIPDGIIFKEAVPAILLEVKSSLHGKNVKAAELVEDKKLSYVKLQGQTAVLNPRHSYFSQVQLGMFLLNLSATHFMIYSKLEPLIITVHRCDDYIDKLVRKLQFVYFKRRLPKLPEAV